MSEQRWRREEKIEVKEMMLLTRSGPKQGGMSSSSRKSGRLWGRDSGGETLARVTSMK